MPFFLDGGEEEGLKTIKVIKVLILGRDGIFIYFRSRDLGFPRVIKLRLLLFFKKGLKEGDISWGGD
jgi:hypothetical protein